MNCHSKVQKWGNSLGIRIRRNLADQLDLKENTEVDITIQDKTLVIAPCRKQYRLSSLLESVKPEDLHGEIDFGGWEGKEAW